MKKRENLKEKVYSTIKKRILKFELKPGEKIFETEIANDLGVSRTPLREALNKLEQEGLIKTLPNKRILCLKYYSYGDRRTLRNSGGP